MESLIPGLVLLAILVAMFIFVANKYHKTCKRINQHVREGNIISGEAKSVARIGDNVIEFTLKASHFDDTEYYSNSCAIGKALRKMFPDVERIIGIDKLRLNGIIYSIEAFNLMFGWVDGYSSCEFAEDKAKVLNENLITRNPNAEIRKIRLTKNINQTMIFI